MKISNFRNVKSGDESALANAILNSGPVGLNIDSRPTSFRFYKSGIYKDPSCSKYELNHGVTAVGVMDSYFIVRNRFFLFCSSWSTSWGMQGYIQIARNAGNICGIATAAVYPILE